LPVSDGAADCVYMWGLVTNMEPEHLVPYAGEVSRMLRRGGRAFLTANVEDDVPEASINPEDYKPYACRGPLHIVRHETWHFLDVFRRASLQLSEIAYHRGESCQSDLYFVKP